MVQADCIFCKIAAGEAPSYTVWEDDKHLAFLTPFPNTEGFTVLITKDHYDSYFAELPDQVRTDLLAAAAVVAKQLDAAFDDVGRTGLIFEGFGVNHIHAKLVPMHGTQSEAWEERLGSISTYFEQYPGYISSHDGAAADAEALEVTAAKIRDAA
jgi:histidine triad (HIT) family protein